MHQHRGSQVSFLEEVNVTQEAAPKAVKVVLTVSLYCVELQKCSVYMHVTFLYLPFFFDYEDNDEDLQNVFRFSY